MHVHWDLWAGAITASFRPSLQEMEHVTRFDNGQILGRGTGHLPAHNELQAYRWERGLHKFRESESVLMNVPWDLQH